MPTRFLRMCVVSSPLEGRRTDSQEDEENVERGREDEDEIEKHGIVLVRDERKRQSDPRLRFL